MNFDLQSLKKYIPANLLQQLTPARKAVNLAPQRVIACDFGRSKIVFLEIEKSVAGVELIRFHKIARPDDPAKVKEELKKELESGGYLTNRVRMAVKGQGVIIRFAHFPQMKPEDLRSSIGFEIEQYIPFKSHEVMVDFQIIDPEITLDSGKGMNVLLVAVKRDDLNSNLAVFQETGFQVELVDVDALALLNALEFLAPEDFQSSAGILDIGTEISTLSIVQAGKPRFIRDISYGGLDIIKRLKRKLGLTHEAALQQLEVDRKPTPEATEVLKEGIEGLVSDLRVSLNYYLDQINGAVPLNKLYVAGGGGYHPIVLETLTTQLGISTQILEAGNKIKLASTVDAEMFKKNQGLLTVPLGLCLRDL